MIRLLAVSKLLCFLFCVSVLDVDLVAVLPFENSGRP